MLASCTGIAADASAQQPKSVKKLSKDFNFRFLSKDMGLADTPLLRMGKMQNGLLFFENTLHKTLSELQREKGEILVDCKFFAQILFYHKHKRLKKNHFLYIDAQKIFRDFPLLEYIRPSDDAAFSLLQRLPTANKGHWVLKRKNGEFIGIWTDGIASHPLEGWIEKLKHGLFAEFALEEAQNLDQNHRSPAGLHKGLPLLSVLQMAQEGTFERWGFENNKTGAELISLKMAAKQP